MSAESLIFDALKTLVQDRVFPDIAPEQTTRPYITYQQVGGSSDNYFQQADPSKKNARFQVNVWADTRQAVSSLASQVESTLRLSDSLATTVLGAAVALYDEESKLRGTRQDFSVWS